MRKRTFEQEEWREFMQDRERNTFRLRLMAHADGYVMVRHPAATPFVLPVKEWESLPPYIKHGGRNAKPD